MNFIHRPQSTKDPVRVVCSYEWDFLHAKKLMMDNINLPVKNIIFAMYYRCCSVCSDPKCLNDLTTRNTLWPKLPRKTCPLLGGSSQHFLIGFLLDFYNGWMQLINKIKKRLRKSDKNLPSGANLCTRLWTKIGKHGCTTWLYRISYRLMAQKFHIHLKLEKQSKKWFSLCITLNCLPQLQAQVPVCVWLVAIPWCVTLSGCRGWLLRCSNYFLCGDIGLFRVHALHAYTRFYHSSQLIAFESVLSLIFSPFYWSNDYSKHLKFTPIWPMEQHLKAFQAKKIPQLRMVKSAH